MTVYRSECFFLVLLVLPPREATQPEPAGVNYVYLLDGFRNSGWRAIRIWVPRVVQITSHSNRLSYCKDYSIRAWETDVGDTVSICV